MPLTLCLHASDISVPKQAQENEDLVYPFLPKAQMQS